MTETNPEPPTAHDEPLLVIDDLRTRFYTDDGVVQAVEGLSLYVNRGETLGIVGESGSGKSVASLSVMRLLQEPPARIDSGTIVFDGVNLLELDAGGMRAIRGNRIAMIFQDPMTSLNPFMRIGRQLMEVLELHTECSRQEIRERCVAMLDRVGIPDAERRIDDYPHQFSGGMRQRVMVAMGLLCEPELLIADEPTTALDVTIQAQILELIRELKTSLGMAVVLITHDLGVVAGMADRVVVMYAGRVMESASTEALFARPAHPYTLGLLRCLPRMDATERVPLATIEGRPPIQTPSGCPFHPRCPVARDECTERFPDPVEIEPGHVSYCWAAREVAAGEEGQ